MLNKSVKGMPAHTYTIHSTGLFFFFFQQMVGVPFYVPFQVNITRLAPSLHFSQSHNLLFRSLHPALIPKQRSLCCDIQAFIFQSVTRRYLCSRQTELIPGDAVHQWQSFEQGGFGI